MFIFMLLMRRICLYFSFLTFSFSLCSAQQANKLIDSLAAVVKTQKDDTNKVNTLNLISEKCLKTQRDKALENGIEALNLAAKLAYFKGETSAFFNIGSVYYVKSNYTDALRNFTKGYELAAMKKDTFLMARFATRKGNTFFRMGDYPQALREDFLSLSLREAIKDSAGMTTSYINLGNVNSEQANFTEALKYEKQALEIALRLKMKMNISACYNNLGGIYTNMKRYPEALEDFKKSLGMAFNLKDDEGVSIAYDNIGEIYADIHNLDSAMFYYWKALKLKKQIGYLRGIESSYIHISDVYNVQKKYAWARVYADTAIMLTKASGSKSYIQNAYENRTRADSGLGDFRSALIDYMHAVSWRDSLVNDENTKKSVQAEMNYEFDKKQSLEKLEQDKKDALEKEGERKQQITIYFISGILLLVIVFAIFVSRSLRQNRKKTLIISRQKAEVEQQKTVVEQQKAVVEQQKAVVEQQKLVVEEQKAKVEEQNSLIEHQKAIVEEKNKDITDSIRYASRIQRALLTTDEYIDKHVKEHFVLFKPRDIVSGDFYWAFSGYGVFYVACCDCTGHGVPGAFMSLLNISMLNESVIERKILRPERVLNDLRDNIIKALNPGKIDSESKDGMDCSLCTFDFKNNTMQAACANNPVWIVRNGTLLVEEIVPDKMPVGLQHGDQKSFTLHNVKLHKGDTVYMFTDGYADQFGGPKGKKFKYKQLQQLLIDNCHLSMQEQKSILDKALEDWKGNLEQVDDILIMGIRV
jgi:serine phosphatase RsbU (regulator of sigma subunit)